MNPEVMQLKDTGYNIYINTLIIKHIHIVYIQITYKMMYMYVYIHQGFCKLRHFIH